MADNYLEKDQAKLYRLIYNRFLASQMSEATFNSVSVDIDANGYMFRATGRTPIFDGWLAAYAMVKKSKDEEEEEKEKQEEFVKLPELTEADILKFLKLEFAQKFTKPPARYTEATLVKAMEEAGIGRPATYNPTIQNISARYYVEKDGKYLKPTELGFVIVDLLDKYFDDIMDVGFTSTMEEQLDEIAYEGRDWVCVVDSLYKPLVVDIEKAMEGEDEIKLTLEISDEICENCGKNFIVRQSRFGKFLGCGGFPACRTMKPIEKPICKSPKCAGDIYKRKSKKARMFFGSSGYQNCDFVAWDEPTGELCKECGSAMVTSGKEKVVKCGNRECGK